MYRSLLLALASLGVFLGLFEGVIRLVGPDLAVPAPDTRFRFDQGLLGNVSYHARDPELGWTLKPGVSASFDTRSAGGVSRGVMTTNSLGFRGAEFQIRKPPGVFRIVFVGDSNAMGFGNSDEHVYSVWVERILDEELGEEAPDVESINLGVDGYTSFQTLRLLERYVTALDPDCVCIQVGFNDHTRSPLPDEEFPFARPALLALLEHSHAYRWMRRQILRVAPSGERPQRLVRRVDLEDYEANVRRMVRLAESTGAIVVLLTTPTDPSTPLLMSEVAVTRDGQVEWTTQRDLVLERLRELGVDQPENRRHPQFLEAARTIAAERPQWAYALYTLERALVAAGRAEEAARARQRWRALDSERAALRDYMSRLHAVARAESTELVDVHRAIGVYAEEWHVRERDLYLDFVHLDARGQVAIAEAIADVLAPHVAARSGGGPGS